MTIESLVKISETSWNALLETSDIVSQVEGFTVKSRDISTDRGNFRLTFDPKSVETCHHRLVRRSKAVANGLVVHRFI